jgi:hypothetical protein
VVLAELAGDVAARLEQFSDTRCVEAPRPSNANTSITDDP